MPDITSFTTAQYEEFEGKKLLYMMFKKVQHARTILSQKALGQEVFI